MNKFIAPLLPVLLVANGLAGCAAPMPPPSGPNAMALEGLEGLVGSRWVANGLVQPSEPSSNGPRPPAPTLNFLSSTQVGGNGGCNAFSGAVVIDGNRLRLGPLASTRKMCIGPAMATETQFFTTLEAVRRVRVVAEQLELLNVSGSVMLQLTRSE